MFAQRVTARAVIDHSTAVGNFGVCRSALSNVHFDPYAFGQYILASRDAFVSVNSTRSAPEPPMGPMHTDDLHWVDSRRSKIEFQSRGSRPCLPAEAGIMNCSHSGRKAGRAERGAQPCKLGSLINVCGCKPTTIVPRPGLIYKRTRDYLRATGRTPASSLLPQSQAVSWWLYAPNS